MSTPHQHRYIKFGRQVWSHPSVLALLAKRDGKTPPEDVIRECARGLVAQALALQWSGPPYDSKVLADMRGIATEATDDDIGAEARILSKPDGSLLIQYDPRKAVTRINFSICHEITHTFFPDCFDTIRHRWKNPNAGYQLECLCDLGAAELLMPHEQFQRDLASLGICLNAVRQLSKRYAASGEAVLIRIAQLSASPCAVVFLSEKLKPTQERAAQTPELGLGLPPLAPKLRVDYVRTSPTFDIFIPTDKSAPDNSVAYRCLETADIEEATERWGIDGFGSWPIQAVKLPTIRGHPRRVAALVVAD